MTVCVMLALAAAAHAAEPARWGPKEWGVLLVAGPGTPLGGKPLAELRKDLAGRFPIEFAAGVADPRELQRAVDRLTAQRVRKLVVVPLALSSQSDGLEETKYVLGLRKDPSAEFFKAPHGHAGYSVVRRVQTRLPVVMASAIDDGAVASDILADRARKLAERPEKGRLVVVGRGSASDADNELQERHLATLTRKVKDALRFADAASFVLRDDAPDKVRRESEERLRKAVAAWSRQGRVAVVLHVLSSDGLDRRVRKLLDGLFYASDGKALMPDPRLTRWVEEKAREAAALPDMRQYKDAGRPVPGPERKRLLTLPSDRRLGGPRDRAAGAAPPAAEGPPARVRGAGAADATSNEGAER